MKVIYEERQENMALEADKNDLFVAWDRDEEKQCRQNREFNYAGSVTGKCSKCKFKISICYSRNFKEKYQKSGLLYDQLNNLEKLAGAKLNIQHIVFGVIQKDPHPKPSADWLFQ
jgi:hypothetical protein